MKTVYIASGGDHNVSEMFKRNGWTPVWWEFRDWFPPDLVCFPGGRDVHPSLYGKSPRGSVGCDLKKDLRDMEEFAHLALNEVPMVGICRGGQFLNVMNGGRLIQDHGLISGIVEAVPADDDGMGSYFLHVDHHQGIVPSENIQDKAWHGPVKDKDSGESMILYAGFYPETKSLCFQPHPEWGHRPTEGLFFNLLEEYIGV